MTIDAWTHLLSPSYVRHLEAGGGQGPGAFLLAQRPLHDVEVRLRVVDAYPDYRQVLAPIPFPHVAPGLSRAALAELVRANNEDMAQVVAGHRDRFAGFVAATPITDADAATEEAVRSVTELGALGVQLEADALNLPLHEERYDPLFAAMERLDAGVWLHPYRTPATPGLPADLAPLLLWQVFGWTLDTTITVCRLVFAGIYERHPDLKLIAHHGGGLIPHFSGRVDLMEPLSRLDPSLGEALARLEKTPMEYLRMLYVDSALFGAPHAVRSIVEVFGSEHVLFATDAPFDGRGGAHFIPTTISDVETAVQDDAARAAIFAGNAERVLGLAGS
jgi:predicted TIM-barrel fold metal-dependent hydrolase